MGDIDEDYVEVDTNETPNVPPPVPKKVSVPPPVPKKVQRKAPPPAPRKKVNSVPSVPKKVSVPPPVPQEVVEKQLEEEEVECVSIEEAKKRKGANRERLLSDVDFESVFGMNKDAFGKLAGWKQKK